MAEILPVKTCDMLIPSEDTDRKKWAVVACDQHTSDRKYWKEVEEITEGVPSAYHIMLPELYLEGDCSERINKINRTMYEYIDNGVFETVEDSFILVRRETPFSPVRTGLMMAFDLEGYDYSKGSSSPIRATEATVPERIPPRVAIRKDAPLEMPHIMILIDDPERTVIEPAWDKIRESGDSPLYSTDLMMNGGHIEGYRIKNGKLAESILNALRKLADPEKFQVKYGVSADTPVLLFAVGDGNHSLATAKKCYTDSKTEKARYALAELVNVHDEGIIFEPIHRVLKNATEKSLEDALNDFLKAQCPENEAQAFYTVPCICGDARFEIRLPKSLHTIAVGAVQLFLNYYVSVHPESAVDYIHGTDELEMLSRDGNSVGMILPKMEKSELFETVIKEGALPRKTFSMGHSEEKRYYMECRLTKGDE